MLPSGFCYSSPFFFPATQLVVWSVRGDRRRVPDQVNRLSATTATMFGIRNVSQETATKARESAEASGGLTTQAAGVGGVAERIMAVVG